MISKLVIVISLLAACTYAQRPSYAGRLPIGYPAIVSSTSTTTDNSNDLGDRFGDDNNDLIRTTTTTTTQRLPIEALGDRDLVDRISKMPLDQQPFWFINWQALEQHRKKPQSYPLKVNSFVDSSSNRFTFQT